MTFAARVTLFVAGWACAFGLVELLVDASQAGEISEETSLLLTLVVAAGALWATRKASAEGGP